MLYGCLGKPIVFMGNLAVSSGSKIGIGWTAADTTDPEDQFHVKSPSLYETTVNMKSTLSIASTMTIGGNYTLPSSSGSGGQVLKYPTSGSVLPLSKNRHCSLQHIFPPKAYNRGLPRIFW